MSIALKQRLINVLGGRISVQSAEIVPMGRSLNIVHCSGGGGTAATILFEPLLQEVDVFSVLVHLKRNKCEFDGTGGFN